MWVARIDRTHLWSWQARHREMFGGARSSEGDAEVALTGCRSGSGAKGCAMSSSFRFCLEVDVDPWFCHGTRGYDSSCSGAKAAHCVNNSVLARSWLARSSGQRGHFGGVGVHASLSYRLKRCGGCLVRDRERQRLGASTVNAPPVARRGGFSALRFSRQRNPRSAPATLFAKVGSS